MEKLTSSPKLGILFDQDNFSRRKRYHLSLQYQPINSVSAIYKTIIQIIKLDNLHNLTIEYLM